MITFLDTEDMARNDGAPFRMQRVIWGTGPGRIEGRVIDVARFTYRVRWTDGAETEQLRPDYLDGEDAA